MSKGRRAILRKLLDQRKSGAPRIVEFPLWAISQQALAQVADGTVQRVRLYDGVSTVWLARSGDLVIAASPVGPATPDEIATWCRARFAESARQLKHPSPAPQHNLVKDLFKP